MGVKCILLYKLPKGRNPDKEDAGTYNTPFWFEPTAPGRIHVP
jgi:hypothetical protein